MSKLPPIKIKKVRTGAKTPIKSSINAAGWNLYACMGQREALIEPGEKFWIGTGWQVAIPTGYEGEVRPKNEMSSHLELRHTTFDADYHGEIKVCLYNDGTKTQIIHENDCIAQIIFKKIPSFDIVEVDSFK